MKRFFGSYGIAFLLGIFGGLLKKNGMEAGLYILFLISFISVVYLEVKTEKTVLRKIGAFLVAATFSSLIYFFIAMKVGSLSLSTPEVSCSGVTEKELVEKLVIPSAKDSLMVQLLNEIDPSNGMAYLYIKKAVAKMGIEADYSKITDYNATADTVNKEFSHYKFSLKDIRTTAKDKELHKVTCEAIAHVQMENYTADYDIEYNAQLGDDKKHVYLKLTKIN